MNKLSFRFLSCLLLLFLIPPVKTKAQNKLSKQQYTDDFNKYISQIKKYYPGLYFYESKENFETRYSNHLQNLPDSLTITDALKKISTFNSGIKDLHLSVGLPKNHFPKNSKALPLVLRKFDDDFFVAYNQSFDSTLSRGTKITSINGIKPIEDANRFQLFLGADNDNPYSKTYYPEINFTSFYLRWYGIQDSLNISYQSLKDTVVTQKKIALLTNEQAIKNTTRRYKNIFRKNFDFTLIDSLNHLAKLDITTFRAKNSLSGKTGFKKNLKERFKSIESDSVQYLILDLRGNGGGSVSNIHRLVSYLAPAPFRLYDSMFVKKSGFNKLVKPYLGFSYLIGRMFFKKNTEGNYYKDYTTKSYYYKPKKKHHYSGPLYVLMDGGSYSATTFTISLLKNMNRATFVGTPPGGANWGSFAGQFHESVLPHSKMRIRIPLMILKHSTEGLNHNDFFVQPDFFVQQNFNDFLERKDTQVNFIKNLIRTSK